MPDRSDAVALLEEWVENDGLRKHMYSVEAAVRHYARMRGEDQEPVSYTHLTLPTKA